MDGGQPGIERLGTIVLIREGHMQDGGYRAEGVKLHPLKTKLGCFAAAFAILGAAVCGFFIYLSVTLPPGEQEQRPLVEPATVARVSAEGAVRSLMNDPTSYSYVSHSVRKVQVAEGLEGFEVRLVFRGTNAFGGVVVNSATVVTDESGVTVLSIE